MFKDKSDFIKATKIYTPHNLIEELQSYIPENTENILDCFCGDGRLISNLKEQARYKSMQIEGWDISPDVIAENILKKDSFDTDISEFGTKDVIISNPPYLSRNWMVKEKIFNKLNEFKNKEFPWLKRASNNMYIFGLLLAYKLLKNKGRMIFLIPSDFLKSTDNIHLIRELTSNGRIIAKDKGMVFGLGVKVEGMIFIYDKDKELVWENSYINLEGMEYKFERNLFENLTKRVEEDFEISGLNNIELEMKEDWYFKHFSEDYRFDLKNPVQFNRYNKKKIFIYSSISYNRLKTEQFFISDKETMAFTRGVNWYVCISSNEEKDLEKLLSFLNSEEFKDLIRKFASKKWKYHYYITSSLVKFFLYWYMDVVKNKNFSV